ncbi:MAG TPA: hypothetical protein VIO58_07620 [Candidatus Methanoperedens sp.]
MAAIAFFVAPLLIMIIEALSSKEQMSCDDDLSKILEALGIPCAIQMAVAEAYRWIFLAGAVAILVGMFAYIARCFLSALNHKKEEEKWPTVSIQGAEPLLLFRETENTGSPMLTLEGVGYPPGGTYIWSVLAGAEKVQLEGDITNRSLPIKPKQRSDSPGDVAIQLIYKTPDGTATARISLTVYTPSSTTQISTSTKTFNGPLEYGYIFTVRYRILDQFGERFPVGFLSLTEDLSVILNPYNTQFEEREYISDSDAEYNDHYTLIFENQRVPDDYVAKVKQVVRAEGVKILDHILVWRSTRVDFE